MTRLVLVLSVLSLTACRDNRPPAPSEDEAAQLNEMDNALNAEANSADKPAPPR